MSIWKQGDTRPAMVMDCFDGAGRLADFDDATLVQVRVSQRGVTQWTRDIPSQQISRGVVTMPLQDADTATVGTFYVKVYAEWNEGAQRQHYPPGDKYMTMTVTR